MDIFDAFLNGYIYDIIYIEIFKTNEGVEYEA